MKTGKDGQEKGKKEDKKGGKKSKPGSRPYISQRIHWTDQKKQDKKC
jgi:hypothetical protein